MAINKIYKVYNESGSDILPVVDGTLSTKTPQNKFMNIEFETGTFVIQFFDASGLPVAPSGGTIVPEMSATPDGQWFSPGTGDATINAVDAGVNAGYTIPVFNGPAYEGRVTLSGITGATTCKAYFWRA